MIKNLLIFLCTLVFTSLSVAQAEDIIDFKEPENKDVVVLIHGLARSNAAMWLLNLRLKQAGFDVKRIGYGSFKNTPQQALEEVSKQINDCCTKHSGKIHFVGHSLGGLLIRGYLEKYKINNLGKVVLIGTPNKGSVIVDIYKEKWWMKWYGPLALSLGTDSNSFSAKLDKPYYPVGVIAGQKESDNEDIIPGKDDGLVSVESTKLNEMTDFVIVNTGHSSMRYDKDVANQTIAFLNDGKFISL